MKHTRHRAIVRRSGQRLNSPDGAGRAVAVVYYMITALFLLVATGLGLSSWEARKSLAFAETRGVVTERWVSESRRHSHNPNQPRHRGEYLHLRYRYEVAGVVHEGDRIEAGTFGLAMGDWVYVYRGRFGIGEQVSVFYDPDEPSTAVLVQGFSGVAFFLLVLTGFFGFGSLFLRVFHRAFREEAAARRAAARAVVPGESSAAGRGDLPLHALGTAYKPLPGSERSAAR